MLKNKWCFLLVILLVITTGCEEDSTELVYDIPETYDFENVSYSDQLQRLSMLNEMKEYMSLSKQQGVALDGDKLRDMYVNGPNAGFVNTYDQQLRDKTLVSAQTDMEALIDELAVASGSTVNGSEGTSGIVTSLDGQKSYLLGDDGLDHAQLVEKGIMAASFFYQATTVLLGEFKMSADNENVIPGQGTAMEHHWDEAFGYLGVPKNFPIENQNVFFWGSYVNGRNDLLGSNDKIMDAFIKGRAAISNNDLEERDRQIEIIRAEWELVTVGTAIHYINTGIESFDDMAIRGHAVSEAIAFLYAIKFNEAKSITNERVDDLISWIAGSKQFEEMNLYRIDKDDLSKARRALAQDYDLEEIFEQF